MRTLLLPLGLLLAATATAATYKWVDKKGVTHYSDKPVPGAVLVDVGPAQTYTPPPKPATSQSNASGNPAAVADSSYKTFEMWRPAPDETLRGNTVTVRVRLEPALRPGHSLWIYLDGKRVDGLSQTGESFELTNVFRGTHTVAVVISDGEGKPLKQTDAVTFHMQQVGLNSPGSRVNQAKPPAPPK